jgi:heme/copper-type cytochrome/quinol oxidase subunit 3
VTSAYITPDGLLEAPRSGSAEVSRWAMLLFLVNEGTLFACLLASYFYLGVEHRVWPPAGVEKPSLRLPLFMTAALLSSSGVLMIAESGFERARRRLFRAGIVGTVVLGVVFLSLQLIEYQDKLARIHPSDSAYASLFYTITGLHGAHVAFGLMFLLWALAREMAGTTHPPRSMAIKNASLYWHFVDGVWLVILTSLYLSPRWW